ncbi:Helicase associated domain protein [Kitasatospora sp. DSM 101779]|nr:Helicase associated domain protein [Kitasatospora sp. DSM 101779]
MTGCNCLRRPCSRASSSAAGSWRSEPACPDWSPISRTCWRRSASRRTTTWWRRRPRRRPSRRRPARTAFAQGLAALAAFARREGHVRVPRPHKEPLQVTVAGPGGAESTEVVHVGLGAWLNNQKARRAKLTPG